MKRTWFKEGYGSPNMGGNTNEVHEASAGMYITESSVYVLSGDKQGEMTLKKNGEKKFDGKEVHILFDGVHRQLAWDNYQGHTSDIVGYVPQVSRDDLLLFFEEIYKREMAIGTKIQGYSNEVAKLLVDPNYYIIGFRRNKTLEQCNIYRIYDRIQYSEMALYIGAAKALGDEEYEKFISNPIIRDILYDMSFDYNGLGLKPKKQDSVLRQDKSKK